MRFFLKLKFYTIRGNYECYIFKYNYWCYIWYIVFSIVFLIFNSITIQVNNSYSVLVCRFGKLKKY